MRESCMVEFRIFKQRTVLFPLQQRLVFIIVPLPFLGPLADDLLFIGSP